jgi:hypothetical protein
VDTHFPARAPATQLTSTPAAPDTLATDLLVRAQAVETDSKKVRQQSNLLISDVYRRQDNLYLRYEVRNNGSDHLKLDEPPVITAASLPHVSFKKPLQLSPDKAAHITTGAPLPLIADQAGASSLAPGQTSRGIIGVHIPPGSNPLAVRVSVPSKPAPLQALVVLP